jgi:flagellar hook-basal body complex protein FliE
MNSGRIGELGQIRPLTPDLGTKKPDAAPAPGGPSFGEALESALKTVDGGLQQGDTKAAAYVSGENVDLHNVLLDLERADLNFRTMVQVRNKLLEAYKEIMRMPV